MEPVSGLPDLVFTANAGVLHEGKAVPSRFRHPERQREERHFIDWFTRKGYEVITLMRKYTLKGPGIYWYFRISGLAAIANVATSAPMTTLSTIFQKRNSSRGIGGSTILPPGHLLLSVKSRRTPVLSLLRLMPTPKPSFPLVLSRTNDLRCHTSEGRTICL